MISVRGRGAEPTTAARAGLGVSAFMKAALGVRFLAGAAVLAAGAFLAAGAVFAGAFFAVAMLGCPCWKSIFTSENLLSHWQADATGKKTCFQGKEGFFCLDL